jgi:hypothetical protein
MKGTLWMTVALLALLAASAAPAQTVISNETVVPAGTTLVVSQTPVAVSCNGICSNEKRLLAPVAVNCPDPTCTVHIALDSQLTGAGGQTSVRFLLDGAAPVPGPTTPAGLYALWGNALGANGAPQASVPASLVATVGTGAHMIAFGLYCSSGNAGGCGVTASTATVRIDVFTP